MYKTRNITACQREGNIIIIVKPPLFPKIQEYNVGYMYTDTLWTNEHSISLTKGLKVSYKIYFESSLIHFSMQVRKYIHVARVS